MWTELSLALNDSLSPTGRRALLLSLAGSVVLLVALWFGITVALSTISFSRFNWLGSAIDAVGSLAGLLVAWMLFPVISTLILGFFVDPFITAIESTHYARLPPARSVGIGEFLTSTLWLTLLAAVLNIVFLPLYFLPVVGAALFLILNGYLVGRQCFESVALRRITPIEARMFWRQHRRQLWIAGLIIAMTLSLPVVNLIAPLVGIAFMLHLFERLRWATSATVPSQAA